MSDYRARARRASGSGVFQVLLTVLGLVVLLAAGGFAYQLIQEHEAARGKLLALGESFEATSRADAKAFDKAIAVIGLKSAIQVDALGSPGGMTRAREALARTTETCARHRALFARRNSELRASLASLPVGDGEREKVAASMERAFKAQDADVNEYWDANEASLKEVDAMLDDLQRARGRWRPQFGQAAFARQSDLDAYNRHVSALNALSLRIERARARVSRSQVWVVFE